MAMTSAQVARLMALTGNWTEPLSIKCAEQAMLDDGRIVRAADIDGLVGDARCLVIAVPTGPTAYRVERLLSPDRPLTPEDCA